jgi:phytoene dehydrogenase-like protein
MPHHDVVIVGAGLAGLACALELQGGGASPLLLEASDGVGGRVRTDRHEGFLLDRGFQVLLQAYPECRRLLDYDALGLHPFLPGADIWTGNGFARFIDPFRRPGDAIRTLRASVGTVPDKLRVGRYRSEVLAGSPESLLEGPDVTARQDLESAGFSRGMIDGFFRPFFGGILLDRSLSDSSRVFRYLFRMFSQDDVSLPEEGMGAIPAQLRSGLPGDAVRLETRVAEVAADRVVVEGGEVIRTHAVVVATEGPEAARLVEGVPAPSSKAVSCIYFEAPEAPVEDAVLLLDGPGEGPVNNVSVPSRVCPFYAPPGRHLVSASCIGAFPSSEEALRKAALEQMEKWFGDEVRAWSHLRTYRIPHAQPGQAPGVLDPPERDVELTSGIFVCGDHRETASIQGALHSGRRAAGAVLAGRGGSPD